MYDEECAALYFAMMMIIITDIGGVCWNAFEGLCGDDAEHHTRQALSFNTSKCRRHWQGETVWIAMPLFPIGFPATTFACLPPAARYIVELILHYFQFYYLYMISWNVTGKCYYRFQEECFCYIFFIIYSHFIMLLFIWFPECAMKRSRHNSRSQKDWMPCHIRKSRWCPHFGIGRYGSGWHIDVYLLYEFEISESNLRAAWDFFLQQWFLILYRTVRTFRRHLSCMMIWSISPPAMGWVRILSAARRHHFLTFPRIAVICHNGFCIWAPRRVLSHALYLWVAFAWFAGSFD